MSVCLFVLVCDKYKNNDVSEFFMLVLHDHRQNRLNFGKDGDHFLETKKPEFSRFHLEMYPGESLYSMSALIVLQ